MSIITKTIAVLASISAMTISLSACSDHDHEHESHTHSTAEKRTQSGDQHATDSHAHDHDHSDAEPLGKAMIGSVEVEAWQGHGYAAAGKELHLTVKLPYSDSGASTIRVWIGTEDRFASVVERATYAPSHDDYDAHAVVPDPLPENAAWWIEITKPDGSVHLGNMPLL